MHCRRSYPVGFTALVALPVPGVILFVHSAIVFADKGQRLYFRRKNNEKRRAAHHLLHRFRERDKDTMASAAVFMFYFPSFVRFPSRNHVTKRWMSGMMLVTLLPYRHMGNSITVHDTFKSTFGGQT